MTPNEEYPLWARQREKRKHDERLRDARHDPALAQPRHGRHQAEQQHDHAPIDVVGHLRHIADEHHRCARAYEGDAKHRLVSQECDKPVEHRAIVAVTSFVFPRAISRQSGRSKSRRPVPARSLLLRQPNGEARKGSPAAIQGSEARTQHVVGT